MTKDEGYEASNGVHAAHCCAMHGCKYGSQCPVEDGDVRQLYPCEQCQDDIESDLPGLLNDMYNAGVRRGLITAGVSDHHGQASTPGVEPSRTWVHGSRLGREHFSVRRHLIEDHSEDPDQVARWSDGAVHGAHDGAHRQTWAYAADLPH